MNEQERGQLRRDDARAIVLGYLHDRPSVAQSADTMGRVLKARGHDFTHEEIRDACHYWEGTGDVEKHYVQGGGTPHFRISSLGINTFERSRV